MSSQRIEDTGTVGVYKFDVTKGYVEIGLEYTKNLGNFENLKIRVGSGRPVREAESASETVDKLYEFVGTKLVQKLNEALEDLGYNG